jgi:hypothetical protein
MVIPRERHPNRGGSKQLGPERKSGWMMLFYNTPTRSFATIYIGHFAGHFESGLYESISTNGVECCATKKMRGFFPFGKLRVRMTILNSLQ